VNPAGVATVPAEVKSQPEGFRSFGEQLQAILRASQNGGPVDRRLLEIKAPAGMSETVSSDGGFLVQTDFAAELFRRVYETGALASRVRRIPISANSNGLRMNAINETSRATGSRWGGIQGYWMAESGTKQTSAPKLRQMDLNLHKLAGLCYATDELLADAAALETVIREGFAEEFAWLLDDAILNGTGAGQPLGILQSGALVSITKETGQAAATFVYENAVKMWSQLWGRSKSNAVWLINQDVEPQLYSMSLAVGTGGVPVYMPANGVSGAPYGTLFGRPVLEIEQTATLGTVGDVVLADLSQYLMIEKGGMESASSIHVKFTTDETAFRFVMRVDGQPAWNQYLTPASGSTNYLSPFIALATRA
jgi:HK97 family phage major capsid protein